MHQLNHSNSVLMKTAVSERPHSTFCSWPLVFLLKKKHSHIFQLISQLCYIIFSLHFFLFITVCQLQYTQFNFFFKNFYKSYMLKSVILLDLWLLSVTHTHTLFQSHYSWHLSRLPIFENIMLFILEHDSDTHYLVITCSVPHGA